MEENKEKNAKERLADLIEKLSRATTFETVREYRKEMQEYATLMREEEQRAKEDYIACLASNLAGENGMFNHFGVEDTYSAQRVYERSKIYLKEAKEFDYLPTVKRLSEELAGKVNKWKKGKVLLEEREPYMRYAIKAVSLIKDGYNIDFNVHKDQYTASWETYIGQEKLLKIAKKLGVPEEQKIVFLPKNSKNGVNQGCSLEEACKIKDELSFFIINSGYHEILWLKKGLGGTMNFSSSTKNKKILEKLMKHTLPDEHQKILNYLDEVLDQYIFVSKESEDRQTR